MPTPYALALLMPLLTLLTAAPAAAGSPPRAARSSPSAAHDAQPTAPATVDVAAAADAEAAQERRGRSEEVAWTLTDRSSHRRPAALTLQLALNTEILGVVAWYAWPALHEGLLPGVNDAVFVELGGFAAGYQAGGPGGNAGNAAVLALGLAAGGRWDFYLTEALSTFVTLKVGFIVPARAFGASPIFPTVGLGVAYRLLPSLALRLDLGYPLGLSLGASFLF